MKLKVKKLYADAKLPTTRDGDVGYDVFVHSVIDCGNYLQVFTGIAIEPPKGFYVDLCNRSSTSKWGLMLYNGEGKIDQIYRGEIIGKLLKTRDYNYKNPPKKGDKIMQLVLVREEKPEIEEVTELSETVRGAGAFGSTGTN